jgi:hypothetical protein
MLFKIASVLILCLLTQSKPKVVSAPEDFAIRISYGDDVIDTFQNSYTRKGVLRKHVSDFVTALIDSTVSLKITSAEKEGIYQQLMKMKYTGYPSHIKSRCVGMVEPGVSIIITVRANKKEKIISYYDDCISTRDKKALEIKRLLGLINKTVGSYEEVKRMPASQNISL